MSRVSVRLVIFSPPFKHNNIINNICWDNVYTQRFGLEKNVVDIAAYEIGEFCIFFPPTSARCIYTIVLTCSRKYIIWYTHIII